MNSKIDKLQKLVERERTAKLICAELNNFTDLRDTLITIISHIKTFSGVEAVSIRLHDDGDYPYFVYDGFPESFIKQENSLCSKDKDGNLLRDPDGEGYLLDCMCGNIIRGSFDPKKSFFTEKGSFFSSSTTNLLATTSEDDRQSRTRNYCNSQGYESVALVPIKTRGERIGIIQLNDKRIGMFDEEFIQYFEMIGEQVGLAIQNSLTHSKLKDALEEIKTLRGIIPICSGCKKIRDDKGFWQQVEVYIREHSDAEFSHSLCPDCMKKYYPEFYDELNES